ncbi:MAG: type II secretion system F family protein [Candidatus Sericytochromatia bacterium]|nr:type II secretion system F family protein [Candidatus Sericytochromatia bacterium]
MTNLALAAAIFVPVAVVILIAFRRVEAKEALAPVGPALPVPNGKSAQFWQRYQERLVTSLNSADSRFPPQRFMALQGGLLLIMLVVGLMSNPSPIVGFVVGCLLAFAGWKLSWGYLAWEEKRQAAKFLDQFAESVGLIANAVKSGLSVLQAFELVAKEMPKPICTEMATVLQGVRIGIPIDVALEDWSSRVESDDLRMFVTAISLQRSTGGPLSEILDTLGETVRERRRITGQIATSTAQGRASAWVLCLLPLFFLIALYCLNPGYIGMFFKHPLGLVMLAIGTGLDLTGLFFIRRIISIDF